MHMFGYLSDMLDNKHVTVPKYSCYKKNEILLGAGYSYSMNEVKWTNINKDPKSLRGWKYPKLREIISEK